MSELDSSIKHLYEIFDNDGFIIGAFDKNIMIGIVALDTRLIGDKKNLIQLYFLHVSSSNRKTGIGRKLFGIVKNKAKEIGVNGIYISSAESINTVDFYIKNGCRLASSEEVIENFKQKEPNDIQLILDL